MRRIIYDVAVSLDGFIAAPGGDVSAFPFEGPHVDAYQARLADYGTVLMGRQTYTFGYAFGLEPGARAYPYMDHHIFSRSLKLPGNSQVAVHHERWLAEVDALREMPGGDIYVCGGGIFAGFLANNARIDVLRLKQAPILLGAGTPLFAALQQPVKLHYQSGCRYENGVSYTEYALSK